MIKKTIIKLKKILKIFNNNYNQKQPKKLKKKKKTKRKREKNNLNRLKNNPVIQKEVIQIWNQKFQAVLILRKKTCQKDRVE